MREYQFESFDGKKINVCEYSPDVEPVGMVQIVHGMAEHIGRYESVCRYLAEKGFIVFGDDHRGHGKTDAENLGKEMGADMFSETVNDVAGLSKLYKETYPDLKLILFGHSYGSFLTQAYIAGSYNRFISGAVIAGSNYFKGMDVLLGSVASAIQCAVKGKDSEGKFIAKQSFGRYEKQLGGNFISSVAEEYKRYKDDEFCDFTCSAGFYRSLFKNAKKLYSKSRIAALDKKLPLLIISGGDDPVGKMGKGVNKLAEFYRKNGVENVRLVILPGSRHEFLNDVGRNEGLEHIVNFCFENVK